MTEYEYGHSDMATWRLKWYYRHWQRRAWRWDRVFKKTSAGTKRAGPAGGYESVHSHMEVCRTNVLWAAANLKRRGWFVA